jgi:FixJ family two-component response regulator
LEIPYSIELEEFLEFLDPGTSGCLVLDARMPGLSGEELQEELKARGIDLPIIVVTADDDPETRRKAQKMGAASFFRKPVDGTALLDAIAWARPSKKSPGNRDKT